MILSDYDRFELLYGLRGKYVDLMNTVIVMFNGELRRQVECRRSSSIHTLGVALQQGCAWPISLAVKQI